MEKKGGIFVIIGIIFIVLILTIGIGIFYLYNFHIFKTVRVCIGEGENTNLPCENNSQCRDLASALVPEIDLSDIPTFIQEKFQTVFEEAVYCDDTCFISNVRGVDLNTQELELLESCENEETEVAIDIRGKEGLEILNWLREKGL